MYTPVMTGSGCSFNVLPLGYLQGSGCGSLVYHVVAAGVIIPLEM